MTSPNKFIYIIFEFLDRFFMKYFFGLFFFLFSFSSLYAQKSRGNLELFAGYRWDEISTHIKVFNPPPVLINTGSLKAEQIFIQQLGLKRDYLSSYCWYIKGEIAYGKIFHGKYKETAGTAQDLPLSFLTADIHGSHTFDASLGIGYLFPFCNDLHIGPVIGLSYDLQKIQMSNAFSEGAVTAALDGFQYETNWKSPWLGIEAIYYPCSQIRFEGGYSYHWGNWQADWRLSGPDTLNTFSNSRSSNHAWGNRGYVAGYWYFAKCWNIGLSASFQHWRASRGLEKPINVVALPVTQIDRVNRSLWTSASVNLNLGVDF